MHFPAKATVAHRASRRLGQSCRGCDWIGVYIRFLPTVLNPEVKAGGCSDLPCQGSHKTSFQLQYSCLMAAYL